MANYIETRAVHISPQHNAHLRVEFVREADRFGHVVQLVQGTTIVPLLASVEGTPIEPGPPSPALQQLHLESRSEGRPVGLLVGMAGRSHWSLSVENVVGDGGSSSSAIEFDVACRVDNREPPELRSTYQALRETQRADDPRRARIAAEGPWEVTIQTDFDVPTTVLFSKPHWTITPGQLTVATMRWKYRLILSPSDQRTR